MRAKAENLKLQRLVDRLAQRLDADALIREVAASLAAEARTLSDPSK
jgi:hypothetical protein